MNWARTASLRQQGYYSYGHKGTVNTITQKMKENVPDIDLIRNNEIDIMPYYPFSNKLPYKSYNRYVAAEKDVLGLIWLAKINIKL